MTQFCNVPVGIYDTARSRVTTMVLVTARLQGRPQSTREADQIARTVLGEMHGAEIMSFVAAFEDRCVDRVLTLVEAHLDGVEGADAASVAPRPV